MAPKKQRFLHQATGRYYSLSKDGLHYVFDDGQVVPVPSQSAQQQPSNNGSRAAESSTNENALDHSMRSLSVAEGPSGQASAGPSTTDGGITKWIGADRQTGIQSDWEIGPLWRAPASNVQQSRSYSPKLIRSNGATNREQHTGSSHAPALSRRGFQDYRRSENPAHDFAQFRVIEILFIPPPPSTLSTITGGPPQSGSKDELITRMRRFVIIGQGRRPDLRTFEALPIKTYNGNGAADVVKAHHAIIYTTKVSPKPMVSEHPRKLKNGLVESGLLPRSIRVKSYDRETMLDPKSRLDFFDLYEFDHNHYFKLFGSIHEDSRPYLIPQYEAVRAALQQSTLQTAKPSAQVVTNPVAGSSSTPSVPAELTPEVLQQNKLKIASQLQVFRKYAEKHGLPLPGIDTDEFERLARDRDRYLQWTNRIKAALEAKRTEKSGGGDEEEDDDDDDDDDDDE